MKDGIDVFFENGTTFKSEVVDERIGKEYIFFDKGYYSLIGILEKIDSSSIPYQRKDNRYYSWHKNCELYTPEHLIELVEELRF